MKIELGISSFGETTLLENTNQTIPHDKRIRNMIEEIELADQVGLDMYAIGEHHRKDFAVSSPEIILAAGAVKTKNIKLSSAVTVLSSADPVRIYQNFSHVDALSNGRAEIMVGRGSFIESFPLFGYDLRNYNELFTEKLNMLLNIKKNEIVNWKGNFTQNIDNKGIYPRAINLPIWVATGGNPNSTIEIAKLGLPITYAIIGGNPLSFEPLINLYKTVGEKYGHPKENLLVSAHSWGYIAENKQEAIKDFFHPTKILIDQISKERDHWSELTWDKYNFLIGEDGAMFVGDLKTVANKLIKMIEALKLNRFLLHLPIGSIPHEKTLESINLFGKKVAPKIKEYFKNKQF